MVKKVHNIDLKNERYRKRLEQKKSNVKKH